MRCVSVPRQLIAAVMGSALLAGCSGLGATPVESPSPQSVINFTQTFETYTGRRIASADDYVWAGYSYVDDHCQTFFNALEMGRKDGVFAKETIAAGGLFATDVLTQLKKSQTAIGIVSGAIGLVTASIDRYNNMYNFAQYSPALWQHVATAQSKYKSEDAPQTLQDLGRASIAEAAVFYQAHQIVQGYARLCSLPQIEYFIHTALTNSKTQSADDVKTTKTSKGGGESTTFRSSRPRPFRMPVYEAR